MTLFATKKHLRAYTLVEVVVATCILVLMGAGAMNSVNYGLLAMQNARENQRATQILLEKVETIRLYNWSQVNSNGFIPATFKEDYDPQSSTAPGITYFGTVTMSDFPAAKSYRTNLVQFVVSLNWTTSGRISHTRSLATVIAKDGEQNYVW